MCQLQHVRSSGKIAKLTTLVFSLSLVLVTLSLRCAGALGSVNDLRIRSSAGRWTAEKNNCKLCVASFHALPAALCAACLILATGVWFFFHSIAAIVRPSRAGVMGGPWTWHCSGSFNSQCVQPEGHCERSPMNWVMHGGPGL